MKKRTEENRRNLAMIAPTWTLTGLALTACIDDLINDEINDRLPGQPGVISFRNGMARVVETNQVGRFEPLTDSEIATLYADVELPGVMDNQITYEIDVISPTTARITIGIEGQQSGTIDVAITGDDAGTVEFFQDGGNAGIRTVNVLDYENPRDDNRDNVYEVSLIFTTQDTRIPADFQSLTENYVLTVTDSRGDDQRMPEVQEGEVMILSLGIADATISGVDAAYVEVAEVNGQMVVRFRSAPDYEAPGDSDRDNTYEFTLTDTDTDVETHIRVMVTNDPSDDQPAVTPDPVVRTTTILPTIVTFSPPDANTGISSAEVRESVSTTAIELRQFEPLTPSDIEALYDSIPLPAGVTENQVTYDISVTGARAATVTIMIVGHADATVNVAITGNDADDIEFVADGGNAGIRSTHAFDYENPLDANADNIYEASLTFTTTDTRIPTNLRSIVQEYRVEVTNDPSDDLPSQAPVDMI